MFDWLRKPRYADGATFTRTIAQPLLSELALLPRMFDEHARRWSALGYTGENSTSFEDCVLLYLLVRHFGVTTAFEVGTFIGTSATFIAGAAEKNGGECITCDPVDCGTLRAGIQFIHSPSSRALQILKDEGRTIDFAFFDCPPDEETLRLANQVFAVDAVVTTHDWKINPKGEQTVSALNGGYRHIKRGRWYLPGAGPLPLAPGVAANICTAFFVPHSRL